MFTKTRRLNLQSLEAREVPADLLTALRLSGLGADAHLRVAADPVGNTYVVGSFSGTVDFDPSAATAVNLTSHGGTDIFVAKYGFGGRLVWARSAGGVGDDSAADVAFDGAGNVYVGGTFNGTADFNPGAVTANLTAAVGGSAVVWKLDFNGNLFLARSVAGPGASAASSIAVDPIGNVFLSGQYTGTADFDPSAAAANLTAATPTGSAFAWRLEANGRYGWARSFDSTGSVEATAIAVDGAGNVYAAGRFTGVTDFDPSASKYNLNGGSIWTPFATKLGFTGNFLWAKAAVATSAPSAAPNGVTGLAVDSVGNVYLAGNFAGTVDFDPNAGMASQSSLSNSVDGFAWKLDFAGKYVWATRFGGTADEAVTDLGLDKAGNTFVAGTFTGTGDFDPGTSVATLVSGSGAADAFLLRLNASGGLTYARAFGGGMSTTRVTGVWADGAGNVYLAGGFSGVADFEPSATIASLDGGTGSGFVAKLLPATITTRPPTNTPPSGVNAGGPYAIVEGQGLTLRATAADANGDALTYSWDLNGDGLFDDATGAMVTLSPAQMATLGLSDNRTKPFTIRVRVSDGVNLAVGASTTLTIASAPPSMQIFLPSRLQKGFFAQLIVSATDASAADRAAGLRYSYDFNNDGRWDFGNGASYGGSVTQNRPFIPRQFLSTPGPLTIKVRVFDKDGSFADGTVTTTVVSRPPTGFLRLASRAIPGGPTTFVFTNVRDPYAGTAAAGLTYSFDFNNDGQFDTTGTSPTATHQYARRGFYTARGRVTTTTGEFTDFSITFFVF